MATALYSNPPLADFVLSEANGQRSRENVTVVQTGDAIPSGSLLQLDDAGSAVFARDAAATGNFTSSAVTVGAAAQDGVYEIEFTSPTAFKVEGPDGTQVGTGATGTAYNTGGLTFTLTAGSTAAVAGDKATIDVAAASLSYELYDGSGDADGVLYSHLPAKTGTTAAVAFVADCEVKRSALIGLNSAAEAGLAKRGIKVRGKVGLPGISTPAL